MMAKRLFTVEVSDELVVYAEDRDDAERFARETVDDLLYEHDTLCESAFVTAFRLPSHYTRECLPWGDVIAPDGHELTIGEILDSTAAVAASAVAGEKESPGK